MTRGRINLLLLGVTVPLLLLVWLAPDDGLPPGVTPLTGLQPSQIQHIRIGNGKQPVMQFERRDGRWWMTEPLQAAADDQRMAALLKILSTPSLERFALPEGELQDFGLTPPRPYVTFDSLRLVLGGTHPYNHNRYLLIGQTLHLIKDVFPHHFLAAAEDFVAAPGE